MRRDPGAVASGGATIDGPADRTGPSRRGTSYVLAAAVVIFVGPATAGQSARAGEPPTKDSSRVITTASAASANKVAVNIGAQPVSTALTELGEQTGLTIIVESKVSKGVRSDGLRGTYTAEEALKR